MNIHWIFDDGVDWKSNIVDISMKLYMTFTPTHQKIFTDISIFPRFFLTVQCSNRDQLENCFAQLIPWKFSTGGLSPREFYTEIPYCSPNWAEIPFYPPNRADIQFSPSNRAEIPCCPTTDHVTEIKFLFFRINEQKPPFADVTEQKPHFANLTEQKPPFANLAEQKSILPT